MSIMQFVAQPNFTESVLIDLTQTKMTDEECEILSQALVSHLSVRILYLGFNQITSRGLKSLVELLKLNKRIMGLILDGNPIDSNALTEFFIFLLNNHQLNFLSLNHIKLDLKSLRLLSKVLTYNQALVFLSLRNCGIDSAGAQQLSYGLKQNTALKHLGLSENNICDLGALSLSSALKINQTLQVILLSYNLISDQGLGFFMQAVSEKKQLIMFEIDNNSFTQMSLNKIANVISTNPNVLKIDELSQFHFSYHSELLLNLFKLNSELAIRVAQEFLLGKLSTTTLQQYLLLITHPSFQMQSSLHNENLAKPMKSMPNSSGIISDLQSSHQFLARLLFYFILFSKIVPVAAMDSGKVVGIVVAVIISLLFCRLIFRCCKPRYGYFYYCSKCCSKNVSDNADITIHPTPQVLNPEVAIELRPATIYDLRPPTIYGYTDQHPLPPISGIPTNPYDSFSRIINSTPRTLNSGDSYSSYRQTNISNRAVGYSQNSSYNPRMPSPPIMPSHSYPNSYYTPVTETSLHDVEVIVEESKYLFGVNRLWRVANNKINIHPPGIFRSTREARPSSGGSISLGWFTQTQDEVLTRWLGKALSTYQPRRAVLQAFEREARLERIAADIYQYFGIPTARIELARVKLVNTGDSYDIDSDLTALRNQEIVHVMSQYLGKDFHTYEQIERFDPRHLTQQGELVFNHQHYTEHGLGAVLAVAVWINDIDVVGGSGANIGFRICVNPFQGTPYPYAQTVKIDTSLSEIGMDNILPDRKIRIANVGAAEIFFDDLHQRTRQEFIIILHRILDVSESEITDFFAGNINDFIYLRDSLLRRRDQLRNMYRKDLERLKSRYNTHYKQSEKDRLLFARHDEFKCGLTLDTFVDPVIASDGHTYERIAIERHLDLDSNEISPNRVAIPLNQSLVPNNPLRNIINIWFQSRR